jgi:hypothetical protein
MSKVKTLLSFLMLLAGSVAMAQTPEPPAELKQLDWMVGEWTGQVKWTMMGMNAEGPMTWKVEKEAMFFKQTSTMDIGGMKFSEVGYVGWDAKKKKFSSHTFTSFAATPRIEWGEIKGNQDVFTSEPWDAGDPNGPTTSRATMTRKGDEVAFLLEFKEGDKWTKVGEGTFKRKK